jgi:DNA-directed RNA polymerase specialized sigma24 family protein
MSEELRAAVRSEVDRLAAVEEALGPVAAIQAVADVYAALDDALAELGEPRLRALATLRREGWSYDRIAAATSLSKGRVAQLAREARRRRL